MTKSELALSERLASQPRRSDVFRNRGHLRGRMGRWREAADDFSKVLELTPDRQYSYAYLAAVLVELGELEAYRRVCAQIRERFGSTDCPDAGFWPAWVCLIAPATPAAQVATGSRLADMVVRNYKGDLLSVSIASCKALAEYRQGRFASAAEWALKALSQPEHCRDSGVSKRAHCWRVEASMLLAMSNYRLHQLDESRAALASGLKLADAKLPRLESGDLGGFWPDWVFADVLMREAKGLIEGGAKAAGETKTNDSSSLRNDPP